MISYTQQFRCKRTDEVADPADLVEPAPLSVKAVVRDHHDQLVNWLRRRVTVAEDADDIAQEAYLRLMKYEGSSGIKSPAAMLYRIATNVSHDWTRAGRVRRQEAHISFSETDLESGQPEVEKILDGERRYRRVCEAIDRLPEKRRQAFVLSRMRGMTYAQVAQHCGISVKMVEKHISRALFECLRKADELAEGNQAVAGSRASQAMSQG